MFPFYLEGYRKSHGPALGQFQSNAAEEAERLGKTKGAIAARNGVVLHSEDELVTRYKTSHSGAGDDEVNAYVSAYKRGYEGVAGTRLEQAERLGKTNGANAARSGFVFKPEDDLATWYKQSHSGADDDEVNTYVSAYKVSYEGTTGTLLEQAQRAGERSGANAARSGFVFKSEDDLAAWYEESHPGAGDDEVKAYVNAYKRGYEGALGTPLEQAERLGKMNGAQAARQGVVVLKSKDDLVAWYEESHPGAGDDVAKAYAESYVKAYNGR